MSAEDQFDMLFGKESKPGASKEGGMDPNALFDMVGDDAVVEDSAVVADDAIVIEDFVD